MWALDRPRISLPPPSLFELRRTSRSSGLHLLYNCTLRTAYLEVRFAPTMKARFLVEAQRGLPLRTRRQQDLVAVGLPGNIERMRKNPAAEPQLTVVGVSDDILNHPI